MKFLRRFVWYLSSRLIIICIVLTVLIIAFYYAMNMANLQVVIKDGMAKRAQVVMMNHDAAELNKYFSASFIERDDVLNAVRDGLSPYKDYQIVGIDHRISMSWMWCWPWENYARADISEEIPKIDGRLKASAVRQTADGQSRQFPPKWQSRKYRANLVREDGKWHIQNLQLLSIIGE